MKIIANNLSKYYLLLLLLIASTTYIITGYLYHIQSYPQGDEPHYLIISQTVFKYHSLDVMQDYTNGDYRSFYPKRIDPHVSYSTSGHPLPLHGIGGPLLWLPFFILGSRFGVIVFMCLVSVLIVYNIYKLLREMNITAGYAFFVGLGFGLCSPIYVYAHLAFIETIAALLCIYTVRVLLQEKLSALDLIGSSTALGLLPWIHIRFALIEVVLFFFLLYRLYQENKFSKLWKYACYLIPVIGLFVLYEAYDFFIWGSLNPAALEINSGNVPFRYSPFLGLLGVFLDQEFGLLTNFPIFILAIPGLILACKKKYRSLNILLLLLFVPYLLMYTSFSTWAGGWCPPCRYLLVLTPTLAFYVALALQSARNWVINAIFALFTLFGFAVGAAYVGAIKFGFDGGHGESLAMAHLKNIIHINFTRYIPSLFLPHQNRLFVFWIIGCLALALAVVLCTRYSRHIVA